MANTLLTRRHGLLFLVLSIIMLGLLNNTYAVDSAASQVTWIVHEYPDNVLHEDSYVFDLNTYEVYGYDRPNTQGRDYLL